MYNEEDYLQLSGIQHFSFCRRQWALIHIEKQWAENPLTAEGQIVHSRAHDASATELRNGVLTVRALPIHSAVLGVSGECDAVEFIQSEDGISLHGREGLWTVRPVEYKRGRAKVGDCDRLQVAAQAMCLEEMFSCRIDSACLFYYETRRRETIAVGSELREQVEKMLTEMHKLYQDGYTPKVKPSKGCANCSLAETCLPDLMKPGDRSVADYIKEHMESV
ncbi:MAG: CRISPR-associated protein Cas4 [Clostridia bacterium]|nr:CRISPR-associated protein Cas4 [Clostridia bacterium]